MFNVRPQIALAFAAPGRLQIHNSMHPRIDLGNIVCAARFQQHGFPRVSQRRHQGQNIFLQQRFAASDLDQRTIEFQNLCHDVGHRLLFAFVKGVSGVAIIAAQIAER